MVLPELLPAEPDFLCGVPMSREWAGEAHDEKRDAFSKKMRLTAWDKLEEEFQDYKDLDRPYQDSVVMLSADRGEGKTLIAGLMGARARAQGMEVFSNASFLFGTRITAEEVFTFAESLPDNCFIFLDEAHTLVDRYSEQSLRNRTLANSLSLLRKKGCRMVLASVHEETVAMSLKSNVQSLVIPRKYRPSGRPKFPPWCYVRTILIGPDPFRGRRLSDSWGVPRPRGPTRKITRPPIEPLMLYEAAKLIDTWEKPSILAGINTTADKIREQGGQTTQQKIEARLEEVNVNRQSFLAALATDMSAGNVYSEQKTVDWRVIALAAQRGGFIGDDKAAKEVMKLIPGLMNTRYAVRIEILETFFGRPDE